MNVDKQTLKDLEIFKSENAESAIFDLIDETKTLGGKYRLREKFLHPPIGIEQTRIQQETICYLTENPDDFILPFNSHQIRSLEEYLSSNIEIVKNDSLFTCIMFCLVDIQSFRYLKNYLTEVFRFLFDFNQFFKKGKVKLPEILEKANFELSTLFINDKFKKASKLFKDKRVLFPNVLRADRLFRTYLKSSLKKIIEWLSEIDALYSMAEVTVKYKFHFPEITDDKNCLLDIKGLYHPMVQDAIPCDLKLTRDSNFIFLTGPNMAGKTTFLKAVGISVFFAHLGMGIPAAYARISYFDRLFTSLYLTDNILNGYSFFYSEVIRVKQLAEYLNYEGKVFALFDELFRGTNVKDAYDASVMIISGLIQWKNSMFILASHLWEIWEEINVFSNTRSLYFESEIVENNPVFSYKLLPGVSNMRLGLNIIEKEEVMHLLNFAMKQI
jgi:DNA mismatch repair ATPase MutS